MPERRIFILAATRTPFGRFQGALANVETPVLAARTIDQLIRNSGVTSDGIGGVFCGVGMIGSGVLTPARRAVLFSEELPEEMPSMAIDRACCSGMTAIAAARRAILCGDMRAAICGGVDVLSRTPRLLARASQKLGHSELEDPLLLRTPFEGGSIAAYTSQEALKAGVDRTMQDDWALRSHENYFKAERASFFSNERFALDWPDLTAVLAADEGPRPVSDRKKLAALKPVNDSATITAGNAPSLSDGAAFMIIGTETYAAEMGLEPIAEIIGHSELCGDPMSGTSTPGRCISELIKQQDFGVNELDLIEINEAFAATPIVSVLHLSGGDRSTAESLLQKTNIHGGAVAIGHPLGASGARITMSLAYALRERGGGRGAAAICGGYGQGEGLMLRA